MSEKVTLKKTDIEKEALSEFFRVFPSANLFRNQFDIFTDSNTQIAWIGFLECYKHLHETKIGRHSWKPIKDAKKNGKVYRLWDGERQWEGSWKKDPNTGERCWSSEDGNEWSYGRYYTPIDAIMFMELPDDPK